MQPSMQVEDLRALEGWNRPSDADWYAEWAPRIRSAIWAFFKSDDDGIVDEIFQSFMLEWFSRDYLGFYDSTKGTMPRFVYTILKRRCLAAYSTRRRRTARNSILDVLDWSGIGSDPVDVPSDTLEKLLSFLSGLPVKGCRDLNRLTRDLLTQILASGETNQRVLADVYGISQTAVGLQLQDLRKVLLDNGLVEQTARGMAWTI